MLCTHCLLWWDLGQSHKNASSMAGPSSCGGATRQPGLVSADVAIKLCCCRTNTNVGGMDGQASTVRQMLGSTWSAECSIKVMAMPQGSQA